MVPSRNASAAQTGYGSDRPTGADSNPPTAQSPAPAATPTPPTPPASTVLDNTKLVKPVTVAELVADEIPWK